MAQRRKEAVPALRAFLRRPSAILAPEDIDNCARLRRHEDRGDQDRQCCLRQSAENRLANAHGLTPLARHQSVDQPIHLGGKQQSHCDEEEGQGTLRVDHWPGWKERCLIPKIRGLHEAVLERQQHAKCDEDQPER